MGSNEISLTLAESGWLQLCHPALRCWRASADPTAVPVCQWCGRHRLQNSGMGSQLSPVSIHSCRPGHLKCSVNYALPSKALQEDLATSAGTSCNWHLCASVLGNLLSAAYDDKLKCWHQHSWKPISYRHKCRTTEIHVCKPSGPCFHLGKEIEKHTGKYSLSWIATHRRATHLKPLIAFTLNSLVCKFLLPQSSHFQFKN